MRPLWLGRQRARLSCAVALLAAAIPVAVASQAPAPLLALKACRGELRVFEDGTIVRADREGQEASWRLSAGRMSALRRIIASGPCRRRAGQNTEPGKDSHCIGQWRSFLPAGMQEVVIGHYPDRESAPFPVYLPCDRADRAGQPGAEIWRRFLSRVEREIGGESILNGCKCQGAVYVHKDPRQWLRQPEGATIHPLMIEPSKGRDSSGRPSVTIGPG